MNKIDDIKKRMRFWVNRLPGQQGNTLAYIAMVLIIFGVIGVAMISLLTSSVTSSATPNHSRRALYMTEAGMRYGLSELRNSEFSTDAVEALNTTTYSVSNSEEFTLNIFGPWFDSASDQNYPSGGALTLKVQAGKLPQDYTIPSNAWVVNFDSVDGSFALTTIRDPITGYTRIDDYTLTIDTGGSFVVKKDERVCLAVQPSSDFAIQTLSNEGENLYVAREAKDIFPPYYGAINIKAIDYVYEKLVDEPANNRVKLENLSASMMPNTLTPFPLTVEHKWNGQYSGNFIVLSPRNYTIIPTGRSEAISAGGRLNDAVSVYDQYTVKPMSRNPDIDFEEEPVLAGALTTQETDAAFITVDEDNKSINIGGGYTPPTTAAFGATWYDEDKAIGGTTNYCSAGACLFGGGVRVFFTLKYSGDGDGLTFALISAGGATPPNTITSVGGDIELSELLGFGGTSLIDTNGPVFLDGSGDGLKPPKMALEFDTLTNNANRDYCGDANTLNQDTRNDPLTDDKDALQYVFWGRRNSLNIPCRNNDPTYDDNRHDADSEGGELLWSFQTNEGSTKDPIAFGRPVFASDGTIHVATNGQNSGEARIYAINPDGTQKWVYGLGDETKYSPGINPIDDYVYADISGNSIVAVDPQGNYAWDLWVDADIDCQPVVTADGTIYFGSDGWELNSVDAAGNLNWNFSTGINGEVDIIPAIAPDGTVYIVANEDGLLAIQTTPTRALLWERPAVWAQDDFDDLTDFNSSPVIDPAVDGVNDPNDFSIYVGDDNGNVYGYFPNGTLKWTYATGDNVDSSPYVDPVSGTIYVGSNDRMVHAIDPDTGTSIGGWPYDTRNISLGGKVQSSPIVDSDGTVYVGSADYRLYAINPDGTLKWVYQTDGRVRTSPGIGPDGLIYVGDTAGKVYAFNRFTRPRNDKNLLITSEGTPPFVTVGGESVKVNDADDWLAGDTLKGPWAVRMEIERSLTPNNGRYEYTLRTWIRQCDTEAASSECTDTDIIGTFFQDTRLEYDAKPPHLTQTIELDPADHDLFERFLFGFTGASGASTSQNAVIEKLQLSFIRPGDPVITSDPNWP